jgi:hypothetical protein
VEEVVVDSAAVRHPVECPDVGALPSDPVAAPWVTVAVSVVGQGPEAVSVVGQGPEAASVVGQGPEVESVVGRGPEVESVVGQVSAEASAVDRDPEAE